MYMLAFLKERSYDIFKIFLYQIAIAIFGISLAIATGSKSISTDLTSYQPATLQIVTSVAAIAFYLFLVGYLLWNIGIKDAGRIARNESGVSRFTGLYMGLVASIINFLVAICIMLGNLLSAVPFFSKVGGISATIGLLIEGMYTGILAVRVNGIPLNSLWFMWFIIIIPMPITALFSYMAGTRKGG